MTKKEMFARIISIVTDEEVINFCNHEIELLDKRSSAERKPTKNQVANASIKETIAETLKSFDGGLTVKELTETDNLTNYSVQKISALISQMVKEGRVVRESNGKKAWFTLAA